MMMTEGYTYFYVKANAMRTAHLEEHAVVNDTQITVQELGAENTVTVRIWWHLSKHIFTQ